MFSVIELSTARLYSHQINISKICKFIGLSFKALIVIMFCYSWKKKLKLYYIWDGFLRGFMQ